MAIDFTDRSPTVDLDRLAALPAGYHIQGISQKIAPAIEGFGYYVAMFGNAERAIQNMIGFGYADPKQFRALPETATKMAGLKLGSFVQVLTHIDV